MPVNYISKINVNSTDYEFKSANGAPAGGSAGQVLAKVSGADFDFAWSNAGGGGGGGGYVPLSTAIVTLAASDWDSSTPEGYMQTVTVTGMTSTANVLVSPSYSTMYNYAERYATDEIVCTAQGTNSLTFRRYASSSSGDIVLNVMWTEDSSDQLIPSGGTTGQVLAKTSGTDYAVGWVNQSGGTTYTAGTGIDITNDVISSTVLGVYFATYGTTTYAQITTAVSANKFPVLFYNGYFYIFSGTVSNTHYFLSYLKSGNYLADTYINSVSVDSTDTWSTLTTNRISNAFPTNAPSDVNKQRYLVTLGAIWDYSETLRNKVTSISSSSTDTEYPTAKCLYDTIAGLDSSISATSGQAISAVTITDGKITASSKVAVGETNQNAFSNVKVGSSTISAGAKTDTVELVAGTNVTLTPDTTNKKLTIAASGGGSSPINVYDATVAITGLALDTATITLDGYDVSDLDGIKPSALYINNYDSATGIDFNCLMLLNVDDYSASTFRIDGVAYCGGGKQLTVSGTFSNSATTLTGTLTNVPKAPKTTTVTLASDSWSGTMEGYMQTVTVTGMTSSATVWASPAYATLYNYAQMYATDQIVCTAQAADSLTFRRYANTSSGNIVVNITWIP
jgi:hypothetical protein